MSEQLDKIAAQDEVSGEWGDKKLKIRGSDILNSIISMVVVGWLVYLSTTVDGHTKEADKRDSRLVEVLEKIAEHQKSQVQATRVTNCMLSIDQKDRQRQLETCERLAR